jgi:predicted dehydrogenase
MRAGAEIVVVGAGSVLELYADVLTSFKRETFVCDLDDRRAQAASRRYGFSHMVTDISAFPRGAVVLNLTPPAAQAGITLAAFAHGHSVYTEKPGAHDAVYLKSILNCIDYPLRFAIAPDTHLSTANSEACRLVQSGEFGHLKRISGIYHSGSRESWHPRPWIFYGPGGGICLDVGPYFLRAIESICGPVTFMSATRTFGRRSDLMPSGLSAIDVPVTARVTLKTVQELIVALELSFESERSESKLEIAFDDHELAFDPVDAGSRLVVTTLREGRTAELVPPGIDRRGLGLVSFVDPQSPDPYFGLDNVTWLAREQRILRLMNGEGT